MKLSKAFGSKIEEKMKFGIINLQASKRFYISWSCRITYKNKYYIVIHVHSTTNNLYVFEKCINVYMISIM